MTKQTTFRAVDPAGGIHRRKTNRVYTHTVVFQRDEQADIANALHASWPATDKRNFEYHMKTMMAEKPSNWTEAMWANTQTRVRGYINGCTTPEEYHAMKKAERLADIAKDAKDGFYDRWFNAGFCGSYALALKLAASKRGERIKNVVILETEVV